MTIAAMDMTANPTPRCLSFRLVSSSAADGKLSAELAALHDEVAGKRSLLPMCPENAVEPSGVNGSATGLFAGQDARLPVELLHRKRFALAPGARAAIKHRADPDAGERERY